VAALRRRGRGRHAEQLAPSGRRRSTWWRFEADKIKGAIRTDFVLSAEIVVIALGTVADQPFATQVAVLSGHRPADDRGRVWPGRRHRQDG
jgi:predicted DNA repair protein MutK